MTVALCCADPEETGAITWHAVYVPTVTLWGFFLTNLEKSLAFKYEFLIPFKNITKITEYIYSDVTLLELGTVSVSKRKAV